MTDRELLEATAKAAGIEIVEWRGSAMTDGGFGAMLTRTGTGSRTWWNPLTDDGDAFRLAVKLKLDIRFQPEDDMYVDAGHCDAWTVYLIDTGGDLGAATRRAIVKAAAAIGSAT